jgi:hypothetical protein
MLDFNQRISVKGQNEAMLAFWRDMALSNNCCAFTRKNGMYGTLLS